jgi:SAM-dependent methyltransferase
MSKADFERWQARYAEAGPPGAVDPFLIEIDKELPTHGKALDVAGGAGRHAIFLARRGLDVTLVDISPRGLDLANRRAAEAGVALSTVAIDLEQGTLPEGPYALILSTSYLPSRKVWAQMVERLDSGGRLVYIQPTTTNLRRHPHPSKRVLIEPGALESLVPSLGLKSIRLEEGWDSTGRHTARLLAASKASV